SLRRGRFLRCRGRLDRGGSRPRREATVRRGRRRENGVGGVGLLGIQVLTGQLGRRRRRGCRLLGAAEHVTLRTGTPSRGLQIGACVADASCVVAGDSTGAAVGRGERPLSAVEGGARTVSAGWACSASRCSRVSSAGGGGAAAVFLAPPST